MISPAELRAATRRALDRYRDCCRGFIPRREQALREAVEAAIDAEIAAARQQWQPIETMPRDHHPGPDTYWGPEVALRVPPCEHFPYGPTRYVGHLEADMWLVRSEDDPASWGELHCAPTHWMPLPDTLEPPR